MCISDWSSDVCSSDLALRLAHQPIDLLQRLCQRLQLREVDAGQVLRLVDQQVCFVLERLDLVVDLLEGARGCQQVLAVVAGVEHGDLRLGGDRKRVVEGKSVAVSVDLGSRRYIKTKSQIALKNK